MPHIHEKIDFTADVFIVHGNRVLLRMHDKYNEWLSVGGHVELNEDPAEAAIREVMEEVGLEVELVGNPKIWEETDNSREVLPPVALNRHRISDTHEHISFVYFARAKSTETRATYADDASEECKWCTKEDLEQMELHPNIRVYALEALKRLGA